MEKERVKILFRTLITVLGERFWPKIRKSLNFGPDGTFKIVQFTDLHWESIGEELDECDQKTRRVVEKILEIEKPDFVVFTGDIMTSGSKSPIKESRTRESIKEALQIILKPVIDCKVPWTLVLGNHEHCHKIASVDLLEKWGRLYLP